MILKANQSAPDFTVRDIQGNPIKLSQFQGNKILLTFYRHVGCPVNHLRFLELSSHDQAFREKGLVVLAVYESSADNLLRYSENEHYHARLIANPEFDLYEMYAIELNTLKLLFSMYKGVYAKKVEGKKRAKHAFEPEGHSNLLGGDFLISEDGLLKRVYYNQFLGDCLPTEEILAFINDPRYSPAPQPTPCCEE
ncbi:redoxin domain-containing protein [Spirosoma radiotolerans]|uniref:Thioredoxin domain-containing protein n=1 Tax=Spirosoma radiotolerans TaxID=1379870 RepID=A0A0E3V9F9_9BACT|nr:redoxin domain-containing protein [Spirosoma radiotolerans]AKD57106.1 hypothetical protein SD10_21645 [Spirosoma radiotolerans]